MFQSLGRDSVLSNEVINVLYTRMRPVSIPRSGFCFVERCVGFLVGFRAASFNPSVGILFCRTLIDSTGVGTSFLFQSLGRDSVLSNVIAAMVSAGAVVGFNPSVGILFCRTSPRRWQIPHRARFNPSVGILFCRTPLAHDQPQDHEKVSIPRSGFCFVERGLTCKMCRREQSFNPSVGILFCRTRFRMHCTRQIYVFQSLGRDSVLSNGQWWIERASLMAVSIPRSGFCFVELRKPVRRQSRHFLFQSLGRDSVLSNGLCL